MRRLQSISIFRASGFLERSHNVTIRLRATNQHSDTDALNFIKGHLVLPPVGKPRRARTLMVCHLLGHFKLAAAAKVLGGAGGEVGVAALSATNQEERSCDASAD